MGATESQAWSWRDAKDEGSQEEPGAGGFQPTGSGPEINEQRGPWSPWSSRVGAKLEQTEGSGQGEEVEVTRAQLRGWERDVTGRGES